MIIEELCITCHCIECRESITVRKNDDFNILCDS